MTTLDTKFQMIRDINGYNGFGLPFTVAAQSWQGTLLIGAEQTITVPSSSEYWLAIFNAVPGGEVWVNLNATAASPTTSFSNNASQMNPSARKVKAGDVIHFITPNTSVNIWVGLYALETNS
jgi:hypothetical protein